MADVYCMYNVSESRSTTARYWYVDTVQWLDQCFGLLISRTHIGSLILNTKCWIKLTFLFGFSYKKRKNVWRCKHWKHFYTQLVTMQIIVCTNAFSELKTKSKYYRLIIVLTLSDDKINLLFCFLKGSPCLPLWLQWLYLFQGLHHLIGPAAN